LGSFRATKENPLAVGDLYQQSDTPNLRLGEHFQVGIHQGGVQAKASSANSILIIYANI
jgi:hypothetical protein